MHTFFKSRDIKEVNVRFAQYQQTYLGVSELATIVGCSNQAISQQLAREKNDFPTPVARLAMGPIWARGQIKEWLGSQTA